MLYTMNALAHVSASVRGEVSALRYLGKVLRVGNKGDLSVRRAHMRDAWALARLHTTVWQDTYHGILEPEALNCVTVDSVFERFSQRLQERPAATQFHILEEPATREILGYVSGGQQRTSRFPYRGEIYDLYVHPDHQRTGVGSRLLSVGIWNLVSRHLNPVIHWSMHENPHAKRFFAACGAVMIGTGDVWIGNEPYATDAYGFPNGLPFPTD